MIFLYFIAFAFIAGVSFIVGGYIGEGRGRRQVMREIEERLMSHRERL